MAKKTNLTLEEQRQQAAAGGAGASGTTGTQNFQVAFGEDLGTDPFGNVRQVGGNTAPAVAAPTVPSEPRYQGPASSGGGGGGATAPAAPNYSTARNGVGTMGGFNPEADAAYAAAMAQLDQAKAKLPGYNGTYNQQLGDIYAEITGRDPFKYDLDADMLYQQYRDKYVTQGRQAMMDTMGQAAALTGGYGSTYSQAAGQQAYDAYLQSLNDVVPSLYDRAYQRWADEGNELYQRYGLTRDLANDEYNRYRDEMSDYWTGVQYADNAADRAYARASDQWNREYQLNQDAYRRQQDEQSRLMALAQIGYKPTAEDIASAGMSEAEAMAYYDYLRPKPAATGGSGGNSVSRDILSSILAQPLTQNEAYAQIVDAGFAAGLDDDEIKAIYNGWQQQAKRVR